MRHAPNRPGPSQPRLLFAVAVVLAATLAVPPAHAQSPFPTADGVVANGTDIALSTARLNAEFRERIGRPYGLDGLMLLVDSCQPDPEVYLDEALVHYGLAPAPGQMYDDAVVWLVCLDPRYRGFFYGADNQFAADLDSDAITSGMVDDLQAGNFTGAVSGTFDRLAETLAAAEGGTSADAPDTRAADGPAADPIPASTQRQAPDGALPLAELALLGAAGLGGWWWLRRRGAVGGGTTYTRPPALVALEEQVAALSERLTADSPALAHLVLAYEPLGDEAVLDLHRRHQARLERLAALEEALEAERASAAAGAVDEAAAGESYPELAAEAVALTDYADALEREAEHAAMLTERAPVLAVEARKVIDETKQSYDAASEGFALPPTDEALSFPERLVDEAEAALTAGQRLQAGRQAEDAAALAERVGALARELREVDGAVERAAELFERVDDYAPSTWADIRGNGSEAEESIEAAVEMLRRTLTAAPKALGADPAAGFVASLTRVEAELTRARQLADAVRQRLTQLETARQTARPQLEAVRGELAEARAWLARPEVDADVDTAAPAKLDEAAATLDAAEAAITEVERPDWLAVLRQIQAADRAVDAALADARAQRERIAALRRQLETARRDAEAALDRAARYHDAHAADIGSAALTRLETARDTLRRAEGHTARAETLEDAARLRAMTDAVDAYETARARADDAYTALATEVERAERRRTDYVPRHTWLAPTVPVPVGRRRSPFPTVFGGWGLPDARPPQRRSSWGSRPSRPPRSSRPSAPPSGGRSSSTRRGGGGGW